MRVSLDWLGEYTDFDQSGKNLADAMTLTSLESITFLKENPFYKEITVGRIRTVEDHPNADKLKVCVVEVGPENIAQIICGAPNVRADQMVPVIHPDSTLPDGNKIEKVSLRGVESNGMIPSERELGLSDSHAGILVLRDDTEVGTNFWDYLREYWQGLEIEITPNRPDCMSHIGIAREISAMNGTELHLPEINITESGTEVEEAASVVIHDEEGCPRYAARVIKNVEIKPSPLWLQERLKAVGLRPINNVVDASNYVLMETGHPLHTFDYDALADHGIEVRRAKDGERFTTLDGKTRELTDEILLICDANEPVAVAGIMGGENSEVTDETTNILIESAYFDPTTVRRGSKYLGLSTEASKRFERGADPNGVIYALNRLTQMIQELADGEVLAGILDEYPTPIKPKSIDLRVSRTSEIIGVEISGKEIQRILASLGFEVLKATKDVVTVEVPTFRPDVEREIDLIEEVLRLYGMENIPAPSESKIVSQDPVSRDYSIQNTLKKIWQGLGFNETFSYSLVNKKHCYPDVTGKTPIRIRNPLSEEMAYMRTMLIPALVDGIKKNKNRKETNTRLFEFGRVFNANPESKTGADEYEHFGAVATGDVFPVSWNTEQKKIDFYHFKGYIEATLEVLGLSGLSYKRLNTVLFKPGFVLMHNENAIGYGGQVSSTLQDEFDLENPAYGVEFNISLLKSLADTTVHYEKPSPYPAVERDLSFVLDKNVEAATLTRTIYAAGGKLLREVQLYDVYEGEQIPEAKKSLTCRLEFLSNERTLTEEEVDSLVKNILERTQQEIGARLRDE